MRSSPTTTTNASPLANLFARLKKRRKAAPGAFGGAHHKRIPSGGFAKPVAASDDTRPTGQDTSVAP